MPNPTTQVEAALNRFRQLGDVTDLQRQAAAMTQLTVMPANSHIHLPPNFSAFSSVHQAVDLATQQGIRLLGISNYYDYTVYGPFSELAVAGNIFPVYGTELIGMIPQLRDSGTRLNDPGNPGKIYICGKGITGLLKPSEKAEHWLDVIRSHDKQRMTEMIARVSKVFTQLGLDIELTFDQVVDGITKRYDCPRKTVWLQERHIAEAFEIALSDKLPADEFLPTLEKLLGKPSQAGGPQDTAVIQGELRSALMKAGKPAFVEEQFINLEAALELIEGLDGIACYPVLADGANPLCEFEQNPEKLAEKLKSLGFKAAELIPIRNAPDKLDHYTKALRRAGLIVTAGTEHNTPDLLPIMPRCSDGSEISQELQTIFWEGACVVAAHQYLKLNDQPGYAADDTGFNNEHIQSMARLGEIVMKHYVTN